MRVLITGGTGFVGSHLVRRCLEDGAAVHLLVRDGGRSVPPAVADRVTVHVHDGRIDTMLRLLETARPDVVFHLATHFVAEHQPADLEPLVRSNLLLPLQLVEGMARTSCTRLVNSGTYWQHYRNEAYHPVALYAAIKQAFEDVARYYVEAEGLRVVTLKLFDSYGPGDTRPKLFQLLRQRAASGAALAMSPGDQLLDLVHVTDVVAALVLAAERLRDGQVQGMESFAVSSGRPRRLRDVVELYMNVTGRRVNISWGARPYRRREVMVPWSGGVPLPGWAPRILLEEGLRTLESADGSVHH